MAETPQPGQGPPWTTETLDAAGVVVRRILDMLAELDDEEPITEEDWADDDPDAVELRGELCDGVLTALADAGLLLGPRDRAVLDAARYRAQVLHDGDEFGSGSSGWYDRDRDSDAAIRRTVDALDVAQPPTKPATSLPPHQVMPTNVGGEDQ